MHLFAAGIVSWFSLVMSCCRSQTQLLRPLLELAVVEIKEVESSVTTLSDDLDSSSPKRKLNRYREERGYLSVAVSPRLQRGHTRRVEHNTVY